MCTETQPKTNEERNLRHDAATTRRLLDQARKEAARWAAHVVALQERLDGLNARITVAAPAPAEPARMQWHDGGEW